MAFEINNKWINRARNLVLRMLGFSERVVTPQDVLNQAKIAWRGAKIPNWARKLYRYVSPLLGAGIYLGLHTAGITPTGGGIISYIAASTIALPFIFYPLTTALLV